MRTSSEHEYLGLYFKLAMGLAVVVCGLVGFYVEWRSDRFDWGDEVFYRTVQLFVLNSGNGGGNAWLVIARVVAAALFVWLAYAAIREIFAESWAGLQLKFFARDHDVVCGLGAAGTALAKQIQEANAQRWGRRWRLLRLKPSIVAIESDPENFAVRQVRARGGIALLGDATDEATLLRARVRRASRIFVATGSDEANVQIVFDLIEAMNDARRDSPLRCYVHVERPGVAGVFGDTVIDAALERGVDVRVFSAARQSAGELVVSDLVLRRPRLARGETDALYVLIGFGPLGQAAAIEIAQLAHFENGRRPAFVIATHDARQAADRFLAEFGAFSPKNVRDREELTLDDVLGRNAERCDWGCDELRDHRDPVGGASGERRGVRYVATAAFVEAPPHYGEFEFLAMLRRLCADPAIVPSIVICLENGRSGFDLAMRLSRRLGRSAEREIAIYVWLPKQAGFVAYLQREESSRQDSTTIVPFGECRHTLSSDRIADAANERLARALHANYLKTAAPENRRSSRPWEKLEPTFRRANFDAARHALVKLHVAGLRLVPAAKAGGNAATAPDLELRETLAKMEHDRWMAERLLDGWRFEPVYSDERLERPQLIPWEDLPEIDREKDRRQIDALFQIFQEGDERLLPITSQDFANVEAISS